MGKRCLPVPQYAIFELNNLLIAAEARAGGAPETEEQFAAWTAAQRRWVSVTEAQIRKLDKRGGTHKPTGDEIRLLQVDATTRLAVATEGILDVMRWWVSIVCPVVVPSY